MFSDRMYKVFPIITKLLNHFGTVAFKYDEKHRLFQTDSTAQRRVVRNHALLLLWAFASLIIVIKYYRLGDIDRFNLTMTYWLAGIGLITCHAILRWRYQELCRCLNGELIFLLLLQSKQNYSKLISFFYTNN